MIASRFGAALTSFGAGAACALTLGYLALNDPHNPTVIMPKCPLKLLTGLDCPACGGLRMTHDLLHGDIAAAAQDNLLLLLSVPLFALIVGRIVAARRSNRATTFPRWFGVAALLVAIAWMVVRNWPGFPLTPVSITT